MTPKIARTGSAPHPKKMSESLHNLTRNTKIWQPPENRTLPNFKPPKMGEACLPTYLTFDMCPGFYGFLVFIFLPSLDVSLISGVPCFKIKVINQFSVYLLHIPSLHYLAEIALHVQGSLYEQFWTLSGSRSLTVLGSLKVPYNTCVSYKNGASFSQYHPGATLIAFSERPLNFLSKNVYVYVLRGMG